ncbi:MAG: response regulator [Nitrospirae bacterium]|nr:response regulator [Nitrospirota bacterium]
MKSDNPYSVLIVDDDKHVLKAAGMLLAQEGYKMFSCNSADNAIEVFKANNIDAVLSDIKMPGITGIELMEQLHWIDPDVPVVLFTAYADLDTAVNAIKKDAFDFIIKPFDPDVLVKAISRATMFRKYRNMEKNYRNMLEQEVNEKTKELLLTVGELKKARDVAIEASRLKSEFLSNMSHEIRTPLNGIIGFTDLILDMDLPSQLRKNTEMISTCASSLNKLLNNILEIAVLESGNYKFVERQFNLNDIISGLNKEYLPEAVKKGLLLTFNMAADLPSMFIGDDFKIKQVLSLLLDNAIKFTEKGDVRLDITFNSEPADGMTELFFSISDTGIGIPEDKVSKVFDSFTQGDGSLTRRHGGTGLGLAIASKVIGMMGGKLRVASKKGKGTDFHFSVKFKNNDRQK